MFKNWNPDIVYPANLLFYESWDNQSSEIWLKCDEEVQKFHGQFTGGATDYFNAYEAIKKAKDGVDPTPQELTKFQGYR